MDIGRYFDFAKKIVRYLAEWISLAANYWREIVAVSIVMWASWKAMDLLIAWTSRRKVVATVHRVERVYYPRRMRSMYLIFTDKGVFRNEDSWAFLRFDSSDVYSIVREGETYELTIYGYRHRWGSEYPNVLRVEIN